MAELRRAVESVASCLGTLQSTNRTLSAELRQALQESRQAAILERERAANERERIFERQNDYVAALLEERQSEAEGNPHATQASEPSTRGSGDAGEMDRLREALEEAQRKVSCLEAERERAREVLRRLQQQRDEAQQTVTRLTQEHRKQTKESGPHDGTASAKRGTRAARSKRPPPSPSRGQSEEETKPHRDGTPAAGGTDAPSPLAAALANSDPSRRKRQRHKR